MFASTLELFTQAASNSVLVFCFCNLIIVVILMGSKPVYKFIQENEIPLSTPTVANNAYANFKQVTMEEHSFNGNKEMLLTDTIELSNVQEASIDDSEEDETDKEDYIEKEDNDELKRRAEAFIDKVNREWRAESQRTSHLV